MTKKLHYFLLLLVPVLSIAQLHTYTGVIKDVTTQAPVELVSIAVENSNIATVSNEEGSFRITVPDDVKTLRFSHLNYNVYLFKLTAVDTLEIFLEPKTITLDEVVISDIPVDKLIKKLLKDSKDHLEKSILMNTYYREFGMINGQYISFADGILDYDIKKASGKADVYVRQSRAKKIRDAVLARKRSDLEGFSFFNVEDAISDSYNFKRLTKLINSDSYEYVLRNKTDQNGNTVQIISILPKSEVHKPLYQGTITYDLKSNLVLEVNLQRAPSHEPYNEFINVLVCKAKLTVDNQKSIFSLNNGKYMLNYNSHRIGMHIKMKNVMDDTFESMSDVVNLDYKEGNFKLDRTQRYREKSLYKAGTKFSEEFWKTKNIILLSGEEENIILSLENDTASLTR
ncbi:MAG: carboxypeptidase-like regulatory domain-containing protein [Flavobacterium sp.]|nr:MAG: carboxypeptidase-like regulatory domain-containing protein [Flavobacterium sp.]